MDNTQSLPTAYITPNRLLSFSAAFWLSAALIGQWLFVAYVSLFYGSSFIDSNLAKWADVLPVGIVSGDSFNNAMLIVHILVPVYVMAAGGLQLIPMIRDRFRRFHRINGRVYLLTAMITSATGIYVIWSKGTVGDQIQHMITTFNGLLILLFAYFTFDRAIKRDFSEHRKWAMRLFVVVSGVWTFRVMLMFWLTINGGPVGIDFETFTGPAIKIMTVAQFALPLLVLEGYFRARSSQQAWFKSTMAVTVTLTALCMSVGIAVAFMGMWLPRMTG